VTGGVDVREELLQFLIGGENAVLRQSWLWVPGRAARPPRAGGTAWTASLPRDRVAVSADMHVGPMECSAFPAALGHYRQARAPAESGSRPGYLGDQPRE